MDLRDDRGGLVPARSTGMRASEGLCALWRAGAQHPRAIFGGPAACLVGIIGGGRLGTSSGIFGEPGLSFQSAGPTSGRIAGGLSLDLGRVAIQGAVLECASHGKRFYSRGGVGNSVSPTVRGAKTVNSHHLFVYSNKYY